MYVHQHGFIEPNRDAVIWRYLDFAKLVSLLDRRALFFARGDRFTDEFEGSYPSAYLLKEDIFWRELAWIDSPLQDDILKTVSDWRRIVRGLVFINCWYVSEVESVAMWDLYASRGAGVAIRSRHGLLCDSLVKYESDVRIGLVEYINYGALNFDADRWNDVRKTFLHKRKSFQHERELRVITDLLDQTNLDQFKQDGYPQTGIYVPVNLDTLVEAVYVHPKAQDWFADLVASIVRKYDLDRDVRRSSLDEGPLF